MSSEKLVIFAALFFAISLSEVHAQCIGRTVSGRCPLGHVNDQNECCTVAGRRRRSAKSSPCPEGKQSGPAFTVSGVPFCPTGFEYVKGFCCELS